MAILLKTQQLPTYLDSLTRGSKLVVVGGCFDILHVGHIRFLNAARSKGDTLMVLLESDEKIQRTKGLNRPYNTQAERAEVLSSLSVVDSVVLLPYIGSHEGYDTLLFQIKPAIIATTKGDTARIHKERQAGKIGAVVIDVIDFLPAYSTSNIVRNIYE